MTGIESLTWTYGGRIICSNKEKLTFLKAAKVVGIREQNSAVAESHRKILQLIACEEKIIFVLEKRRVRKMDEYLFTEYRYENNKTGTNVGQNTYPIIFTEAVDRISKYGHKFAAIKIAKEDQSFFNRQCDEFITYDMDRIEHPSRELALENGAIVNDSQEIGKIVRFEWECHGLVNPSFFCEDSRHNFLVASSTLDGVIYSMSPSGKYEYHITISCITFTIAIDLSK